MERSAPSARGRWCSGVSACEPRMVDEPLTVVVDGTSIIVTMLSTDYSVTYQKQFANPHLLLTHTPTTARACAGDPGHPSV